MMKYDRLVTDLRRIRAQRITMQIMQEISPFLDGDHQYKDVSRVINELLWRSGADVLTDMDRHDAGLPDRGNLGWTPEELHILELKKQELLLNPLATPFRMKTNLSKEKDK